MVSIDGRTCKVSSLVESKTHKGFIPHAVFQYYSLNCPEAIVMLHHEGPNTKLFWHFIAEGLASA